MSKSIQNILRLAFFSFCLICFLENTYAQVNEAKNLTRNDVVVNPKKTSVYICIDKNSEPINDKAKSEILLRLYNNTIWTIRFNADAGGTSKELLKLNNGTTVAALTNNSTAYPLYQIKQRKPAKKFDEPAWGHVHTASFLPSNKSASFAVPKKYFSGNDLYVRFFYEWELKGSGYGESYAPEHRVHFYLDNYPNIVNYFCDEN